MNRLQIGKRAVGAGERTFVIAEIGINHDGSADRAVELVRHAASAGADAVKLQIFTADSLMHASAQMAGYQKDRVSESDPAGMLRRFELSRDDLRRICAGIEQREMIPLATPFSPADVDLIEDLNLPAIKIASPDIVNCVLLERAAKSGRPLLVSTGAATVVEIEQAVHWLRKWDAKFLLMHCVSSYPTPAEHANLCWIAELDHLGVPVGYSDHTTDPLAGAMAVAAGACAVEKHLTYDQGACGPDHAASADPRQLAQYIQMIRSAEALRGRAGKRVLSIEDDVRTVSRQSLVLARDVKAGQTLRPTDLTVQRPGTGILSAQFKAAVGRAVRIPLPKGTLLQWDMLSDAA